MLHAFRESVGKYVAIAILGLIAVTFIFFGIDFTVSRSPFAAKVNGTDIPMLEFERELQSYQTQYQELYRVELTDELRREIRRTVVDQMVLREALRQQADRAGYFVSNGRLAESIRSTPAFQIDGTFNADTYRALLAANGLTPAMFETQQREALRLSEFQDGIAASTFLTPAEYRTYIEVTNQRRELGYALFEAAGFIEEAVVDETELADYHAANQSLYMTAESVDIEYIDLELAAIAETIDVTDAELRAYYDEVSDRFETEEERRVSHILITPDGDDYQAAEAEVAAVLERLNAGEDFAALAAEVSDDGGTSQQGGDLGWMARGIMAGPFEDALYSMELGEIEGPVETEFGYHILKLDEIRRGQIQIFESVREELRTELSTERANSIFYDRANQLRQAAFDAYDELGSVAERIGLELEIVEGFGRAGDPERFPNGAAVVERVFAEDAIISGRNSDLIELSDDHVVIVRVIEHHEPEPQPFEAVADQIREQLQLQAAQALAAEAAAQLLTALEQSPEDVQARAEELGGVWNEPAWVGRSEATVPVEILATAFAEPSAAIGDRVVRRVPLRSGDESVIVLSGVQPGDPEAIAAEVREERLELLAGQNAQIEIAGYAANVSDAADVRVPDEVLNPQF